MSLKSELLKFLLRIPNTSTASERKALLDFVDFGHLNDNLAQAENKLVFFSELLELLRSEGQDSLGRFLRELAVPQLVGYDDRNKLHKFANDICALTPDGWNREFYGDRDDDGQGVNEIPKSQDDRPEVEERYNTGDRQENNDRRSKFDDYRKLSKVDYRRLEELLRATKWLEADQETIKVLFKASKKQEFTVSDISDTWQINSKSLSSKDFQRILIYDLIIIDNLWREYSKEKFGFHTQVSIYKEQGQRYYDFCDRVGWRKNKWWVKYNDLFWSLDAPDGHLPWIQGRKMYLTSTPLARDLCFGSVQLWGGEKVVESEETIISALCQKFDMLD